MKYNKYGDLSDDNLLHNEKSSPWMVALGVTLANVSTFLIDRYIFDYEFSRVGFNSIRDITLKLVGNGTKTDSV